MDRTVLRAPRLLTETEMEALRECGSYRYVSAENDLIRSRLDVDKSHVESDLNSAKDPQKVTNQRMSRSQKLDDQSKISMHSLDAGTLQATAEAATSIEEAVRDQEGIDDTENVLGSIPLYDPACQPTMLANMELPSRVLSSVRIDLTNPDNQRGRVTSGMYSAELEAGETSKVFNVRAAISSSADNSSHTHLRNSIQKPSPNMAVKVAIKRLHEATPVKQFLAEYESLRRLNGIGHPNVVETLAVFRYEETGIQYFNFMFPLAIGNLKHLFRGSYDKDYRLQSHARVCLWQQFVGLASALAYLHESLKTAHRDIKPSNILIYSSGSVGADLVLKITDFGLAVDLTKALTWEQGSLSLQSAWSYDSPEIRQALDRPGLLSQVAEKIKIPTSRELLSNDVWKMGCVFTEMTAFLVRGGSDGVSRFRNYIRSVEAGIYSDFFNDTRFDDGKKVKPQVIQWLDQVSIEDERCSQLGPLFKRMLATSPERPTAVEVCCAFLEIDTTNIQYDDGVRLVQFIPEKRAMRPGLVNSLRLSLERRVGHLIDWSPFAAPTTSLTPGQTVVAWNRGGCEFSSALSGDELERYQPTCLPVVGRGTSLLPIFNNKSGVTNPQQSQRSTPMQPLTNTQAAQGLRTRAIKPNNSPPGITARVPAPLLSTSTKDMYWCVEQVYTEPSETLLCPILEAETLTDDYDLYQQVNLAISKCRGNSVKGWLLKLISWKRCTEIQFIKFYIVWKNSNRVSPAAIELPPLVSQEYEHNIPQPYDVHMKLAGIEIVRGLMKPKLSRGETTMVKMLPKRSNPPPFTKDMGSVGWGLHVKMGFSARKFIWWLVLCIVANAAFAATWLFCMSSTDLQNAFVPTMLTSTALTIALAMLQLFEK